MNLRRRQVLLGLSGAVSTGLAGCTEELPMLDSESETAPRTEPQPEPTPEGEGATGKSASPESSGSSESPVSSESPESSSSDESTELVFSRIGLETAIRKRVNEYRTSNQEDELRWEPLYQEACRRHSEAMASADALRFTIDGKSASERVMEDTNCGADITIARLSRVDGLDAAAKRVVEAWRQDSQANEKLLGPVLTRIGVGVAANANGHVYVTGAYC